MKKEWYGDHPYYLVIVPYDEEGIIIDLDEGQWLTTYSEYMRKAGMWLLARKDGNRPALQLLVNEGDQPYYVARHMGVAGSGGSNEIIAFGIGKKQADGSMVRLWAMPDGTVCGGDDVDRFGIDLIHRLGPRTL